MNDHNTTLAQWLDLWYEEPKTNEEISKIYDDLDRRDAIKRLLSGDDRDLYLWGNDAYADGAYARFIEDVKNCKEELVLSSALITSEEVILAAIESRSPVKVFILDKSITGYGESLNKISMVDAKAGGIFLIDKRHLFRGRLYEDMHHIKAAICDDKFWRGSANFTKQSRRNNEFLERSVEDWKTLRLLRTGLCELLQGSETFKLFGGCEGCEESSLPRLCEFWQFWSYSMAMLSGFFSASSRQNGELFR